MRVHILGLGPAGVLMAQRARARGWEVHGYDPCGLHDWPATYGMVDHDLPEWFLPYLTPAQPLNVITTHHQELPYRYRMVDNSALVDSVRGITVHARHSDADEFGSDAVIDCRGAQTANALWQVAVGYVVDSFSGTAPLFMDWTTAPQQRDRAVPPSFLYVQPVADGWLCEETILATTQDCRQPAVRERLTRELEHRLNSRPGIDKKAGVRRKEFVFIPMGTRARHTHGPTYSAVGARAGMINPATGYSVAAVAASADRILDRIKAQSRLSGRANAFVAHLLRNIGGELIATADQETLRDFFACFFKLPQERQLAYLTGDDGVAVARTMWQLRHETTMRHEFLKPLFRNPWRIVLAAWRRSVPRGGRD